MIFIAISPTCRDHPYPGSSLKLSPPSRPISHSTSIERFQSVELQHHRPLRPSVMFDVLEFIEIEHHNRVLCLRFKGREYCSTGVSFATV
jgi:hypothetical protein